MSKYKINLISTELLEPSSTCFHEKKFIEWTRDYSSDISFYVGDWQANTSLQKMFDDPNDKKKYYWILESPAVIPGAITWIEQNYEAMLARCEGIFTSNEHLCTLHDRIFNVVPNAASWIIDKQLYTKSKLVSMIASNKSFTQGHLKRLEYIKQYQDKVDFFGRGFREIEKKEQGLCDYMFSIAIENCETPGYFSEKITDCFATGTIPIYLGAKETVSKYFNPNGIIFLDEAFNLNSLTKELYYDKIEYVKENLEIAKSFPIMEDYIFENYIKEKIK
jgi:hypothetical protein